ncbi:MAG: enoyl-CoA hydratase/isomerase family protein [Proteobacteria bacterium]|nr:enoyl-CoA hydratase/isomerase family protein [Pseudomonadota bacterium]
MSIRLTIQSDVGVLEINRPERRNALSHEEWHDLRRMARSLGQRTDLRAVIVHGVGGHFCAGMDLKPDNPISARLIQSVMEHSTVISRDIILELKACLREVSELPVPVVAAIEGACVGGGMELALCADLRIAATDAVFRLPETRIGMIPDLGGTAKLTRLVGPGRATDLVLSGRKLLGEDALVWGLAERTCAPGTALETALAWVDEMRLGGPKATRLALNVIRTTARRDQHKDLRHETALGARAIASGEAMIGVAAFAAKTDPDWT